jgi:beta-galactosidase GanA
VDSREIEKIADYKIAYVPYAAMLDTKCEETLKKFAENGGTLLLDEGFGLREKNTWLTNRVLFPNLIDAVWHNRVRDYKHKNESFTLDGERVTLKPYRTDYEVENAEVLATFDDSMPAIFKVNAGMGEIILLGASMGYSYAEFGENGWKKFVKKLFANIPTMENYGNAIVTTVNETPDGELHYLFNTGKEDVKLACKFDKIIFGAEKISDKKILLKSGDVACIFVGK